MDVEAYSKKQILDVATQLGVRTQSGAKWVTSSFEYWNKKGVFPDPVFVKAKVATIYDKESAIIIVKKLAEIGGKDMPAYDDIAEALTTA